ncbi:arabinosyltransferase domain-containing protein [Saccharopolyspora sp. HNM0983]|uniref:Arabinosyltransferase domain-containing protein n=1 Tax=Saccharopolyspora montiporae TaxID=2781240 RepID=A0A929G071_9PSEU|nr:arabinosyltransferase domain-containing protein [Saccharopolyspora sp. HNM0983]MBE9374512.1 arabinosyltransferase domain-containing protein [Saccharopolyspora sp. HNM0983]
MLATIFGLVGAVLALLVPFLPVNHDVGTLKWPTEQGTRSVSAPLVSYSPLWLESETPCSAARSLDARTDGPATLLSTNPPSSDYGSLTGLGLQVDGGQAVLLSQGQQVATEALPPGDCSIALRADAEGTTATIDGTEWVEMRGDQRPQLTGIFSELDAAADDISGVSFEARVDNRFASYATPLKIAVMLGAVAAFAGSIVCLRRLDVLARRQSVRLVPRKWWKPTLRDGAVYATLGAWWLIGAMTSDDGYVLNMIRSRESAGYVSNYYRWFANPESPFGWFYELYALWVQISTATPWVRLPALLMGIVSWLLISREVMPRLGQRVRRSNAAGWAAAGVFLAFWLPYNNGLRAEPVVVLCSLLALCAVERAVATSRLMPAALGLVAAAFSVGVNPHGLVAVAPFIAAIKPLYRLVRKRAREFGWLPVLAPLAASGFVILVVVFADQTWQSVMDSMDLKTEFGPHGRWYEELSRYDLLFSPTPDGSLTRRFPVLLVMLCLVTCAVVLLRRSRIRGAALGPSRRLLAITAMGFAVLAVTPTKHTHHFGIFAAFGGALAALTALATTTTVLRSRRNRAAFVAGLMVILAFAATGPNAWWYVSGWGVPWFDKPPSFQGYNFSTLFLLVAAVAGIVALVEHLRIDENNPKVVDESWSGRERQSRALRLGTAPLSVLCALMVLGELAAFGKVIQERPDTYSLGTDNIKQLTGSSCGLSDYISVETDPKAGILRPAAQQPGTAAPTADPALKVPPERLADSETADEYLREKQDGFREPGVPQENPADPEEPDWQPPHRFGGPEAPVWGSYDDSGSGTGELRTPWYELPQQAVDGELPVVLSIAGVESGANSVTYEFGRETENGFEVTGRSGIVQPGAPRWRDHREMLGEQAEGATMMRVVAVDHAVSTGGWLAVSAPRVPQLEQMTAVVGDDPTFVEWPAALVHPCLRISGLYDGIAEMPKFRVAAGAEVRDIGMGWSSPDAGGPFGWMTVAASVQELPTYLRGDTETDWGSLYRVDPYEPDALPAEAALELRTETHWGTWSPGALAKSLQLPGDVPTSDDRTDIPGFQDQATADDGGN